MPLNWVLFVIYSNENIDIDFIYCIVTFVIHKIISE